MKDRKLMLFVRMTVVMSEIVTFCPSNNVIKVDILLAQTIALLFFTSNICV